MMSEMLGPYHLGPYDTENWGIYTGDARELSKAIPDESVDLVLTDPPYPKEYLRLYSDLAQIAGRILRKDGYLLTLAPHQYLPEILELMSPFLTYWWINAQVQARTSAKHWSKDITIWWKPVLVFRPLNHEGTKWFTDMHFSARDKRFHKWGQSESAFSWLIQWLGNGIVFDPFTGGGTVPAVCKMLGRRWLAFEIDPDIADLARQRVAQTQPPLNLPMPEQMALELDNGT